MDVDPMMMRTVMGRFTTGVAVVTSLLGDEPVAMTANAIASVSLTPPLILFCADTTSKTLAAVRSSRIFAVNFLSQQQEDLARRFSASGPKSFEGLAFAPQITGAPVLKEIVGWLDCTLEECFVGGDHEILIGRVVAAETGEDRPPLVFYRSGYHSLAL